MNRPQAQSEQQPRDERENDEDSCTIINENEEESVGTEEDSQQPNLPSWYFGDAMGTADEEHIRLGSINFQCLKPYKSFKEDSKIFGNIIQRELDVVGMQETGVNWSVVPRKHQWIERSHTHFEKGMAKAMFAYNEHDNTSPVQ